MNENMEFKETNMSPQLNSQVDVLKARAFMFLEDGDWDSADNYCERILDEDPTNATAYLGKLMAQSKVPTVNQLLKLQSPLDDNIHYQKILRFGDENLKNELVGINEQIKQTYQRRKQSKKRKIIIVTTTLSSVCLISIFIFVLLTVIIPTVKYNEAESYLATGDYENAITAFNALDGYKDSIEKAKLCKYKLAIKHMDNGEYTSAHKIFSSLGQYKDSKSLLQEVSWEIVYKYFADQGIKEIPVETSIVVAQAGENAIMLGYALYLNGVDDYKVDITCVASIQKDGTVDTMGMSNSVYGTSTEHAEAYGRWEIHDYKAGDTVTWGDMDIQRTGLFQYADDLDAALVTYSPEAFHSMVVGLALFLEASDTGVTVQDLGFYLYK